MEEEVLVLVVVVGFNPVGITPAGWSGDGENERVTDNFFFAA